MTKEDNNNRSAGIPRPYASKTLPTPGNVLQTILSPVKIWQFLVLSTVLSVALLLALIEYSGFSFSQSLLSLGGLGATAAIGIGFRSRKPVPESVPSIRNVSNTSEYYRASSRLTVYTIGGTLVSMFVHLAGHLVYPQGAISEATTLTVTGILVVSILCSYIVVLTLCSYSPRLKSSPVTNIVEVSSLPEILAILGFVVAPIAVFIAGSLWKAKPLVILSFEFTIIDSLAIVIVTLLFYISAVSRL